VKSRLLAEKARTVVVVLITLGLVWSSTSYAGEPGPTPEAGLAVWGSLPSNARVLSTDPNDGVRSVELTETLPESIDRRNASCHWLIWPLDRQEDAPRFLMRSIHYTTTVVTPEGTFSLGVKQGVRARSADGKYEGVLAHLCFDPGKRGDLKFPLPSVFEDARQKGIVTPIQKETLASLDQVLVHRFQAFGKDWKDFSQSTYVRHSRNQFLDSLEKFHLLVPGMSANTLDPGAFFNREQRMKLRALGHDIRGRCVFILDDTKLRITFKQCPLFQVASEWNRIAPMRPRQDVSKPVPELIAAANYRNREIDGSLDIEVNSRDEAEKLALGLLLSIEGLSRTAP
jgi:hypothetical protein